jgi:penicillin amidase
LQATFLAAEDHTAEALWDINRANDWNDFRAATEKFLAPQENIVFADTGGTIGFIAPARIPIRRDGNGWLPMPGWTGAFDWTGFIPFAELPQATNPGSGHFVSANNKIVPDSYPHFLTRDWDLPNRAERIEQLLAAATPQSPTASAAIQADTLSFAARRLVPLMTRIVPDDNTSREAVERLQAWDFRMDAAKVEPLLFTAWLRTFAHDLFFRQLGDAAEAYWDLRPRVIEAVLSSHPEWCGDPQAKQPAAAADCDALLASTLDAALASLRRAYGPEMAQWQWGREHIAEFVHPVFSRIAPLRAVLPGWAQLTIPTDGGFDTVNRGATTIRDEAHPFAQRFGAGLRMITDLAAPADSRMIAVPGQSGNPLSPHFGDMVQPWRDFRYLVPGRAAAVATLTLEPAR